MGAAPLSEGKTEMNTFKAYRIKNSAEIAKGDTLRARRTGKAYTFRYVADNGSVATQENGEAVFLHHPGDFVDVMVRDVSPKQPPAPAEVDVEAAVWGTYHSIDSKYIKSYKTKKALAAALFKMGATKANGVNVLCVCTSSGRFTAIIGANTVGGNMTAFEGFMKFA